MKYHGYNEFLGGHTGRVSNMLHNLDGCNVIKRIWNFDHTVWSERQDEIENRLAWLTLPVSMVEVLPEIESFRDEVLYENFSDVVLLGMGGSSLAAEMFSKTFDSKKGYPILSIVDTTDPEFIIALRDQLNFHETLVIVSTKSGTTIETVSLMNYFFREFYSTLGANEAGKHFAAITDPGSTLSEIAQKLNFRKVFLNEPNVGGRFSALSFFGLVPAALIGVDVELLLERSRVIQELCKETDLEVNQPAKLGVTLGSLAKEGIDKLTVITSNRIKFFKFWLEQLVAESTGKQGVGILPVLEDKLCEKFEYSDDRLFVFIKMEYDVDIDDYIELAVASEKSVLVVTLEDLYDLGKELFRWEFAVAVAGNILEINPFNQPNVEASKKFTRSFISSYQKRGSFDRIGPRFSYEGIEFFCEDSFQNVEDLKKWFEENVNNHDSPYIALLPFLNPNDEIIKVLNEIRTSLAKRFNIPVTVGFGPRYLHSTGQLHKGDSGSGIFIIINSKPEKDILIPNKIENDSSTLSFGNLKDAQAFGDYSALVENCRKVLMLNCSDGISKLKEFISLI